MYQIQWYYWVSRLSLAEHSALVELDLTDTQESGRPKGSDRGASMNRWIANAPKNMSEETFLSFCYR